MRKKYIDNLRWSAIIVLIIYHAAMAWNTWDEPNYIIFEGNRVISGIVVFFSPFLMPLLFVLAGMSTRYAFGKRTVKQYFKERIRKLLIPFVFGTLIFMPVMTYIADRFNQQYEGTFLEHYKIFFTRFTDLTGADGGFSVGQFWFLLYLFVISAIAVLIINMQQKLKKKHNYSNNNFIILHICLLGLPILIFHEILSVGGKSIIEYLYLFLIGYYIFFGDEVINKLTDYNWLLLFIGVVATLLDIYLFLWVAQVSKVVTIINTIARFLSEWFMILATIGIAKNFFDKSGKIAEYMSQRSFMFYMLHYIWVVLFQYLMFDYFDNTFLLYIVPVILAYIMTFLCCEICNRSRLLCFLMGTKLQK